MTKYQAPLLAASLLFCHLSNAQSTPYEIKEGETLSGILYRFNIKPLYGPRGSLVQTLRLNPHISENRGNKISPSQVILLPSAAHNKESKVLKVSKDKETTESVERIVRANSRSDIVVDFSNRFISLKSTDEVSGSSANLISDAGSGYKFTWGQSWSQRLRSTFFFESHQIYIKDSSTKLLQNKDQTLSQYGLGLHYKISSRLKLNSSIAYGDSLVNRSIDSQTIKIESFTSSKVHSGLEYKLFSKDHLSLVTLGEIIFLLPAIQDEYKSELGFGHLVGLGLEDRLFTSDWRIHTQIFYKQQHFQMREATFKQREIGFFLGLKKNLAGDG